MEECSEHISFGPQLRGLSPLDLHSFLILSFLSPQGGKLCLIFYNLAFNF